MITGIHTMFYSSEPEALREFIRDKLQFSFTDVGHGWLIFDLPEADMGVHPVASSGEGTKRNGTHDISFYCDDLDDTMKELQARGVEFVGEVKSEDYGMTAHFMMPGDLKVQLFEPHYKKG